MMSEEGVYGLGAHRHYPGDHASPLQQPKNRCCHVFCRAKHAQLAVVLVLDEEGAAANRATEWTARGDEWGPLEV
jgi:hypothetical protein